LINQLKQKSTWFFYFLFCAALALTWFFHKDATRFTDKTEMWSDRAGYYIYLPATFFYHFDTHRMPADLDIATGAGFSTDTVKNKLETKYTYGVALMVSPFFFTAALVSRIAGFDDENGFSMLYMRMMSLAAVFYLILGLWFLRKFLHFYFPPAVTWFVITLIFLGTNLFYYALIDGMMSHVYSFFLFALFLFALKKFLLTGEYRFYIILATSFALAVLIRPTNILLGSLFFLWDAGDKSEWMRRVKQFMKPAYILVLAALLFTLFLPQLVYWKYLSGHWLHFSYRGEGFANWNHPKVAEVLFSPVNGLFPYTPLVLLFVAGIFIMLFRKKGNGWLIAGLFGIVTIICASWKMWYFGCSFGQRSFIEYYTIMAVPFGWFATTLFNTRKTLAAVLLFFLVLLFAYINLGFTFSLYRFERCYYGSTWDWDHYHRSLERAAILSPLHQVSAFQNDFENLALSPVVKPSQVFTRSGLYSIAAGEKPGITPLFSVRLNEFGYPYPKMMDVEAWVLKPGKRPTGAAFMYTLRRGGEVLFGDELKIDSSLAASMTWTKVSGTFIVPDVLDSNLVIDIFIASPKPTLLFIDDLKVHYRYRWN
jgi:hypothetical protein